MKVLAHVHTFNDADIIDRTIAAVRAQTRPVDGIILVDNASVDDTLNQPSLDGVTILPHTENLGTSGAVITGMEFALEHNYDWIWVFDADSVPAPDALENLLKLYSGWSQSLQDETAFMACLPRDQRDGQPYHGGLFTEYGITLVNPLSEQRYYPCHITIWSGCLYRIAAIRQIGLPNPDYVLDWGEFEYGYRVMKSGYKGFIDQDAGLTHNIRGNPSLNPIDLRLGPATARFYEFPPIRCYYMCRNMLYFVLYDFAQGKVGLRRSLIWCGLRFQSRSGALRGVVWRALRLTVNFLIRPRNHGRQITACLRGIWHGLTGNAEARY